MCSANLIIGISKRVFKIYNHNKFNGFVFTENTFMFVLFIFHAVIPPTTSVATDKPINAGTDAKTNSDTMLAVNKM